MSTGLDDGRNPIVFFDITIGGHPAGRVKMELFADKVPKTAENFRSERCGAAAAVSSQHFTRQSGARRRRAPLPPGSSTFTL